MSLNLEGLINEVGGYSNILLDRKLKQLQQAGFDIDRAGKNRSFMLELDRLAYRKPEFAFMYMELLCLFMRAGNADMLERLRSFVVMYSKYEVGKELVARASKYYEQVTKLTAQLSQHASQSAQLQERQHAIEVSLAKALDDCILEAIKVLNLNKMAQGDNSVLEIFDRETASMRLMLEVFRSGLLQQMSLVEQQELLGLDIEIVNRSALRDVERVTLQNMYYSQLGSDQEHAELKRTTFDTSIDNPHSRIGLIALDQKIVGALILCPESDDSNTLYGSSLVIDPAFIGKGCMLPYIQKLLEEAGKHRDIIGDVFANNGVALNFYKKLGFVREEPQPTGEVYQNGQGVRLRRPASVSEREQ